MQSADKKVTGASVSDAQLKLQESLRLSNSTLRTILRLSENIIVVVDKNGIIIEASNLVEKTFGIPLKDIIGKISWEKFIPEEDVERLSGYFQDRAKGIGSPPTTYTLRVIIPGEESRFMRLNVGFIPGTENRLVILKDLSDVVLEQRKTAQTEERYRTVVENTQDGILICHRNRILFVNSSFCRMAGLPREQIYAVSPVSLFQNLTGDESEKLFMKPGRKEPRILETHVNRGKKLMPVELSSTSITYRDTSAVLISVRDLSQRKEAEKKLKENHKLLKAIVDNSPIGVSVHDRFGTLLMSNASWRFIWNKSIDDLEDSMVPRTELCMNEKDSYLGEYINDVEEVYRKGGELYIPNLKIPNPSPGGTEFISHHFYALMDETGEVDKVVILTLDLTEALRTRDELQETRNQYRELSGNVPVAVYRSSMESGGRIVFSNPEMQRMFCGENARGIEEISVMDLYVDSSRRQDLFDRLAEDNEVLGFEAELKRLDGSTFLASISARKVKWGNNNEEYIEGIIRDITDQRRAEEELQTIEHLESIGTLAGGIAHDFNNLLMAIQGNISLARNEKDHSQQSIRLDRAEASIEAAAVLTRQLLTFARGGVPEMEPVDVASFLRETVLFSLRGSDIEAVFNLDDDLKKIEVDRDQIAQVIKNITLNSVQSMSSSGHINVSCSNAVLEDDSSINLEEGEYVKISITDTGKGIPPGDLKKIFNPYFTTKPDGSGLGLSTSHSIISRHSGVIKVHSEEGKGTEFVIFFPALGSGLNKSVPPNELETEFHTVSASILIMDDDTGVREVLSGMLAVLGHDVIQSSDGAEAIELYREKYSSGEPFDLVIMDLTIPGGMGGEEAVAVLRDINPDVRAIVSSGYANNPVMSNFMDYGFSGRLSKPFRISTLRKELSSALKL